MQHGPIFLATSKCTISKWAQYQFSGLPQSISALPCSWQVVKFDSWVCMGLSVWLTHCHDAENVSHSMGCLQIRQVIFLKETTLVRGPLEAMSISEKTEARTSDLPGNKSESRVRRSDHLPQWSNLPCTRCMQRKSHDVSMQTWLQYVCSRSHTTDRTSGWTRTCQMP